VRKDYLAAVEALVDITYLIGEALVLFQQISDGLGDYGTLRVAKWLHPFLEAVTKKVLGLKTHIERLNKAVDEEVVAKSARGYAVEKPSPSQRMGQRALQAIDRAVTHDNSHLQELLVAVTELTRRSSPDRLPQVVAEIGDACMQLDTVLSSPDMQACVGDIFPNLSRVAGIALPKPPKQITGDVPQIIDVTEVEGTILTNSLRVAAAARCEQHEVDVLMLTPHLEQGEHALTPRMPGSCVKALPPPPFCKAGDGRLVLPPPLPESGSRLALPAPPCPVVGAANIGDSAPGYQAAALFTEVQNSPKAVRTANWSLPVHMNERKHAEGALALQATVIRLTSAHCGPGFHRHDRRALTLYKGQLDIFEKGSAVKVKTSIRLKCDVEECLVLPGRKRLSMVIRRVPPGVDRDSGVWNMKAYFFEFGSADEASAFHSEITKFMTPSS